MSDGDVFFRVQLIWGVAPPLLLLLCIVTWFVLSKTCFTISDLWIKMKSSCIALLYLLWPSLCSQTFSLFACQAVCDEDTRFLRVDLNEVCWEGKHASYAFGLGVPMLILYVIGLPAAAFYRVYRIHQDKETRIRESSFTRVQNEEKIFGLFYTR